MKYLLLIYDHAPGEPDPEAMPEYMAISQAASTVGGAQLMPPASAATVRVQDGRTLTTDGPFAETKEQLGGFFLVEAPDLDAAIDVAGRIPAARQGGAVEIRPLVER